MWWRQLVIVSAVCLLSPWSTAQAAWQLMGTQPQGQLYLEPAKLVVLGPDTVQAVERLVYPKADSKGIKALWQTKEYNFAKQQVRVLQTALYNAKGRYMAGKKQVGGWQSWKKDPELQAEALGIRTWSRRAGTWVMLKQIGANTTKSVELLSSRVRGKNVEAWEKLSFKKPLHGVSEEVIHTIYNTQQETALTDYACTFDAQGKLLQAGPMEERWSKAEDTYGEYLAPEIMAALKKKK